MPSPKQFLFSKTVKHYARFLLVGGMNTVFGYLCYAAAIGFLHLALPWALLLSQIAGILFNFQSYGRIVFGGTDSSKKESFIFIRFLIAYGITYIINLGLLNLMAAHNISAYLAQAAALIVVVPVSYLILRLCVWRVKIIEGTF